MTQPFRRERDHLGGDGRLVSMVAALIVSTVLGMAVLIRVVGG